MNTPAGTAESRVYLASIQRMLARFDYVQAATLETPAVVIGGSIQAAKTFLNAL